jgi:hypothetical protein
MRRQAVNPKARPKILMMVKFLFLKRLRRAVLRLVLNIYKILVNDWRDLESRTVN